MEQQTIQLQEILMNLKEENIETTLDFLLNSNYISYKQNLYLLVHNFFIAASCRPHNMMLLSSLLFSLYMSSSNLSTALKYLPQALQDEAKNNRYAPFYFFYCLMKSGFPSDLIINCVVDQFDHSIKKSLINKNMKILKDDQIFYGYALFVPELIEAKKFDWFAYIINYYSDKQYMKPNFTTKEEEEDNDDDSHSICLDDSEFSLSKNVELFIDEYQFLSANNFEKYHEYRDFGWNPDQLYVIIKNDDESKLENLLKEIPTEKVGEFVNKPIKWSVFERCQFLQNEPLPLHVAAFFNSVKCFAFLVSQGADLNATDLCGRTVVQFAVAGGCEEMRLFDRNKCSYEGALHVATKFHRYQFFELVYSNLSKFNNGNKKSNSNQISSQTTGGCSTTADTSDIEGDSTNSSVVQAKPKIKKTEIKTRSESKPKPENKPKTETAKPKTTTKSKNSFGVGLLTALASNGPLSFLSNNIKGLGTVLHQAALSNCMKILTSLLAKPQNKEGKSNSNIDLDLNGFVNDNVVSDKSDNAYSICYSSFLTLDTPLIVAIKSYNIEAFNFLLSLNSVDVNGRNSKWLKSPFHVAAKRGYDEILNTLLNNDKIDFNPKDINGRTPVFEAVFYMKYDILKILADCDNIDFKEKDNKGKKPSEIELIVPVDSDFEIHYGDFIRLLRKCCH